MNSKPARAKIEKRATRSRMPRSESGTRRRRKRKSAEAFPRGNGTPVLRVRIISKERERERVRTLHRLDRCRASNERMMREICYRTRRVADCLKKEREREREDGRERRNKSSLAIGKQRGKAWKRTRGASFGCECRGTRACHPRGSSAEMKYHLRASSNVSNLASNDGRNRMIEGEARRKGRSEIRGVIRHIRTARNLSPSL